MVVGDLYRPKVRSSRTNPGSAWLEPGQLGSARDRQISPLIYRVATMSAFGMAIGDRRSRWRARWRSGGYNVGVFALAFLRWRAWIIARQPARQRYQKIWFSLAIIFMFSSNFKVAWIMESFKHFIIPASSRGQSTSQYITSLFRKNHQNKCDGIKHKKFLNLER